MDRMMRRSFLKQLAAIPFLATAAHGATASNTTKLKILMKSAWGSDEPTKAAFPFRHADALSEAGRNVQIFLLGEAASLMRKSVANAVVPVGWCLFRRFLPESSPRRYQPTHAAPAPGPEG
jgi:hypothetical protein